MSPEWRDIEGDGPRYREVVEAVSHLSKEKTANSRA